MKISFKSTVAGLIVGLMAGLSGAQADQIINLRSGNGGGATDSAISMLVGPLDFFFGSAFTATDFANARTGPQANIIGNHPAWIHPSSFTDLSARWISTNATASNPTFGNGASALFAIDFTITDAIVSAATLDFDFAVDNALGNSFGGPNEGLFLNGTALSGSTSGGGFSSVFNITRSDIAPLLVTGTNTLYINMTDVGGPSGLIFSATITTEGSTSVAVPEPGMVAVFGMGLIALGLARRKSRR